MAKSRIDHVSLECRNSRVPIELIGLLKGKDVLVGCIDVATNKIETPEKVAVTIRAALDHVPADRLYPGTNRGMAPMAAEVAYAKLAALAAGAEMARKAMRQRQHFQGQGRGVQRRAVRAPPVYSRFATIRRAQSGDSGFNDAKFHP